MLSLLLVSLSISTSAGGVIDLATVGQWTLSGGQYDQLEVTVPGSVYTDLQTAGILGSLYYRFNDVEYRWVAKHNWTYSTVLTLSQAQLDREVIQLDCHGLDTVATIIINQEVVATTNNMFIR